MKLIVGLGNPGADYEGTRHNVGFAVVRRLADRHRVKWQSVKAQGTVVAYEGAMKPDATLLMPQLLMNRSGEALSSLKGERPPVEETLIVCDDVNLPVGTLRMRAGGGAGGHHGLLSCLEHLKTEDVPRLRVGVGRDPLPRELTEFVLSPFESEERPIIDRAIEQAVEACEVWRQHGIDIAMNRVNVRPDDHDESTV